MRNCSAYDSVLVILIHYFFKSININLCWLNGQNQRDAQTSSQQIERIIRVRFSDSTNTIPFFLCSSSSIFGIWYLVVCIFSQRSWANSQLPSTLTAKRIFVALKQLWPNWVSQAIPWRFANVGWYRQPTRWGWPRSQHQANVSIWIVQITCCISWLGFLAAAD